MRLSLRHAAILVGLTASLGACNIYGCRYKTRFVGTTGSATRTDVGTVTTEYVNFREHEQGETAPSSLTWSIRSSNLVALPRQMTLRDARDTTKVIASLGIQTTTGLLSFGSHDLVTTAERDAMFRLLASGNAVLVLELQTAGVQPLVVPLAPSAVENWHRARCD